jgi:glycosyltransferase involved in cell wall biosynthesis
LDISSDEVLILGVGRLTPQKNYVRFIEMVARVHRTTPIKAVIAGRDDGCLESLQRQINQAALEPGVIRFIGPVPDARELMCAADVFVLSSDYEGMPNVVLEAMAARVPCVCTRVNGVSALIDQGVNGFITDHRADRLAEKVLSLVRDKELRQEMGARAAERVRGSFDPGGIAARLWQLCE